jgi:hypothetical protein
MNRTNRTLLALLLIVLVAGVWNKTNPPLSAEAKALAAEMVAAAKTNVDSPEVPLRAALDAAPAEALAELAREEIEWLCLGEDPAWPGVLWDLFRVKTGPHAGMILRCTEPGRCRPGYAWKIPEIPRLWVPAQGECQILLECPLCVCKSTATATPVPTSTSTPTATAGPSPTASPTGSATATATATSTATATATATRTPTPTATATATPTASATRTNTPDATVTGEPSGTPTPTPTGTLVVPPPKPTEGWPYPCDAETLDLNYTARLSPVEFGTVLHDRYGAGHERPFGAKNEDIRDLVEACQSHVANMYHLVLDYVTGGSAGTDADGNCVVAYARDGSHPGAEVHYKGSHGTSFHIESRVAGFGLNEGIAQMRDSLLRLRDGRGQYVCRMPGDASRPGARDITFFQLGIR